MENTEVLSRTRIIRSLSEAEDLCEELLTYSVVSVDSEWYNNDPDRPPINNGLAFSFQFGWRDREGEVQLAYLHNHGECEGLIHAMRPFFVDPRVRKVAHNAPVDWHILANHGIIGRNMSTDTMVADFVLDENREFRHNLKECAEDLLGHESRGSFKEVFWDLKKKKDGTPYANNQRIARSLPEYVKNTSPPLIEDAFHAQTYGTEEEQELANRWLILYDYACADVFDGLLLYEYYEAELSKLPWVPGKTLWDFFLEVETPITDVIMRMERKGMQLDLEFLATMSSKAENDLAELRTAFVEWAGAPVSMSSRTHLRKLLYGVGDQPIYKNAKAKNPKLLFSIPGRGYPILAMTESGTEASTAAETIVALRRMLVNSGEYAEADLLGLDILLVYNKYEKQRNTYLEGLQEAARSSRIHCRVNQIGASSGRWSTSNPNLQNITTGEKDVYHIRDAFCAAHRFLLIVADFSQLEYRLLAHFSQEPKLISMFNNGWDLHSLTCYNIYPDIKAEVDDRFGAIGSPNFVDGLHWLKEEYDDQRKRAKTLNFEIIYGVGFAKLAEQLRISEDEAKRMIDGWFSGYPYVKAWFDKIIATARAGQPLRTLAGRYRRPNMRRLMSSDRSVRGEEERTLKNAVIQGSAADVTKRAMLRLDASTELRELDYEMTMQVHDEIVGEIPKENAEAARDIMRPLMENPFSKPLRVPMPVSIGIGPSWSTAKV